jgi:ribosomal protein S12 methylthiotransferase accessory factor
MPPQETLARIRPHLAHGAITRVGDITGLDTIGVPVAVAVRPASATITVESGKGLTWIAAMTSAAMEAIERFVAETDPLVDELAPVGEVADRLPIPADRFPMFKHASISPHRSYEWTDMHDLPTVPGPGGPGPPANWTSRHAIRPSVDPELQRPSVRQPLSGGCMRSAL